MVKQQTNNQQLKTSTWVTPTLATGWTQFDTGTTPTTTAGSYTRPRYIKDISGVVHLTGLAKNSTGSNNTPSTNSVVFTLPVGFRPGNAQRIGVIVSDLAQEIDIDVDGSVKLSGTSSVGASGWVSLNNLSFMAEQ